MTSTALLLFSLALPQAPAALPTVDPVFVEVTIGRGSLLAGEVTMPLSSSDGEQWVEGQGHLSLAAGASAALRWHERASLEITGPCDFEWQPCTPEGPLKWNIRGVKHASIEVRKSELQIELADAWSLWMPAGAMVLTGLPGQDYEVFQQAGGIATFQWSGPREYTRPAQTGVIGTPVRLSYLPCRSRDDQSARLDGRQGWTWPWRDEAEDVVRWSRQDWPWVAGPPRHVTITLVPWKAPEPTPPPTPMFVIETPAPAVEEPTETAAHEAPIVVVSAEPEPSPVEGGDGTWGWDFDETDHTGSWRGLDENGYRRFGDYYVQLGAGLIAEELPDGGVRFTIPDHYEGGGWVLGPRLDARIASGGTIEYSASGTLRGHSGGVRVLAAIER